MAKIAKCNVAQDSSTISYPSPDENYGESGEVRWGKTSSNVYHNAYIQYDLSKYPYKTNIKPIISAKMMVYQYRRTDDGINVPIYRVTSSWGEYTITHNNQPSYNTSALGTINTTNNGWKSLDITNIVKNWLTGVYPNYGIRIYQSATTNAYGYSREYEDPSYRPYLEIAYIAGGMFYWWF